MRREVVRELFFVIGRVESGGPASSPGRRPAAGEPQGQRPPRGTDSVPRDDRVPSSEDLSPDVAATFERLWRAARARQDEKPPGATDPKRGS